MLPNGDAKPSAFHPQSNPTKATAMYATLKAQTKAYCTICGCATTRKMTVAVAENTPVAIERAKNVIRERAAKEYTCRVCKSIAAGV